MSILRGGQRHDGEGQLSHGWAGSLTSDLSPGLEVFDPAQHVQVSSRVLLDHVFDIIRPQSFLKTLLVQEELHDPGQDRDNMLGS